MSLALIQSRARCGLQAPIVTVEVHLSSGLPAFLLVGLPETSVKEARDRVRSALLNSGFEFPDKKITVNLAPADLPKESGRFDLAIALGILKASGQLQADTSGYEFYGELALSGALRPIVGEIPLMLACQHAGHQALMPLDNASQARQIPQAVVHGAAHLLQVHAFLQHGQALPAVPELPLASATDWPDLQDVRGQQQAKRALELAAAGGHHLLMYGPAGTGKSMLAQRLPGLLPPLTASEALSCAAIYSIAGQPRPLADWQQRPFRQPHHSCSAVALVGGSSVPRPGEISLAHHGVLFLDELPEFPRTVLEVLRQPLEAGTVFISRAARQAEFPAEFQLVAALNPSPSGHHQDGRASHEQIRRYLSRLSGPLLDRIDLQVEVPLLPIQALHTPQTTESTAQVRSRVWQARERQLQRQHKANVRLSPAELEQYCQLSQTDRDFLALSLDKLQLSARCYHKLLRVARTIADLAASPQVRREHMLEAISYRAFDRLLQYLHQS
ncbi:YifB family Mg chelatase-like AAA ATPase [Rheinheimera sp.]|uniref:YifB family Mg chelatase-like AAA ATPase n=1 Tax=Rheinheimera sp. TaxID=1869214 RepID=UPI00307D1848